MADYWTDEARWLAVRGRDRNANSAFYYGVTTTQIFCRPTCPGRIARRGNIIFFNNTALARNYGYRACKRCKPDEQNWSRDEGSLEIISLAQALIRQAVMADYPWTVEDISRQAGVSAAHLHRLFKKHLGITPKQFAASMMLSGVYEKPLHPGSNVNTGIRDFQPALFCNVLNLDFESLLTTQPDNPLDSIFDQDEDDMTFLSTEPESDQVQWTDWLALSNITDTTQLPFP